MKKSLLLFLLCATMITANAQVPQMLNYQAIVRNEAGVPLPNTPVVMRFTVIDSVINGAVLYVESDSTVTSEFGQLTCRIGNGTVLNGSFTGINWAVNSKYLEVEAAVNGGGYVQMGTTQLVSVPYALYAANSGASVGFAHYIGQLYGGGIVVAVWKDSAVEHGLIASLTDISTSSIWSNVSDTQIGDSAESNFDVSQNTSAIIGQSGATSGAAFLCNQYTGGGYTDWYLPAIWELQQCWIASMIVNKVLGGTDGFQAGYYWSSTEANSENAYYASFQSGITVGTYGKFGPNLYSVRAVRSY